MNGLQQVALQVLIRGLSLATLPIVCRTLGPEAYSTVVALVALHLLATACASFGFHGIIARRLAATPEAGGSALGAAVLLLFPATLLATSIPLVGWQVGLVPSSALGWLIVALMAQAPAALAAGLIQVRPGQRGFGAHQFASAAAAAVGPLVGMWWGGAHPGAFMTGLAVASLVMLPWHLHVIFQARPAWPAMEEVRGLLAQAFPLAVGVLAGWSCDWIDRLLLGWWHPSEASGGYALGAGIAIGVLGAVQTGLMVSWSPNHHRDPASSAPATRRFLILLFLAYGLLLVGAPAIGPVLGGAGYQAALQGAWLIGTAQVLAALNGLQVHHLLVRYDTRGIMMGTLAGGLVSVVGGVLLIPSGGLWGAGVAQILGHAAAGLALGFRSKSIPHHPFQHLQTLWRRHAS